jgi:electron transport complex protein RnfB
MNNNLAQIIENALPQTQCTKCGFKGCKPYAQAIANGEANYNQCPPGGQKGVEILANILQKPIIPLNIENGLERVRHVAVIDKNSCIGCTLCIQACPVDAIVGAAKHMHDVITDLCTGCDLCVTPCPVDCISMEPVTSETGWEAWSNEQANSSRQRYEQRNSRIELSKSAKLNKSNNLNNVNNINNDNKTVDNPSNLENNNLTNVNVENLTNTLLDKKAIIAAAMARAKQRLEEEK